jgi:hypothetical protein
MAVGVSVPSWLHIRVFFFLAQYSSTYMGSGDDVFGRRTVISGSQDKFLEAGGGEGGLILKD